MSFNPVGNGKAPNGKDEPVGAFEVSKTKRICQYSLAGRYETWLTDKDYSPGRYRCHLLPLRSRDRIWICSDKTSSDTGRGI